MKQAPISQLFKSWYICMYSPTLGVSTSNRPPLCAVFFQIPYSIIRNRIEGYHPPFMFEKPKQVLNYFQKKKIQK